LAFDTNFYVKYFEAQNQDTKMGYLVSKYSTTMSVSRLWLTKRSVSATRIQTFTSSYITTNRKIQHTSKLLALVGE